MTPILDQCQAAARAANQWAMALTDQKNKVLHAMSMALRHHVDTILLANEQDCQLFKGPSGVLDRLTLTKDRIHGMADGMDQVIDLPDPIGEVVSGWVRPNGLQITQRRVPLGVVGMIYEARPNVTSDAIALCLKTGNGVVLRGSSSAIRTNQAIVEVMRVAGERVGLPLDLIQLLSDTSREGVLELVQMNGILDLVIPRGGASLIQTVVTHATVPCIETGVGNCHIFIDETANVEMALAIIENAKVQRPSVCNSVETVLIHDSIAPTVIPALVERLNQYGVECRGCEVSIACDSRIESATPADWDTEYLDLIIAIRVVPDLDAAVAHIEEHGTRHSEAIITTSLESAQLFVSRVDAAAVLVNASTRFVDGGEFGFGAEIGISTQKTHARGPMGLTALTSVKYVVMGNGQCR